MNWLLDIETILFKVGDYPLSTIELLGTLTGLFAVWYASRNSILTWPISLLNVAAFFAIFYQVRLYSDMFLQVFFFVMSVYGWIIWRKGVDGEERPVTAYNRQGRIFLGIVLVLGTLVLGYLMSQVHIWFPQVFPAPAAYPYPDGFTTVASVLAQVLLARRKWENWVLWVAVDVVATVLYYKKGILFVSGEYLVFLGLATYGLISWWQMMKENARTGIR